MAGKVLWIAPALLCAGLGWWALSRLDASERGKRIDTRERRSGESELAARLDALEAENRQVRRDLATTRLAAVDVSAKLDSAEVAQREDDSEAALKADRATLAERQAAGMALLEEELAASTTAEPPDHGWASTVETAFRAALSGLQNGPRFESARCGSSLCAVVVSQADDEAHVALVNALQGKTHEFGGQFLARRHPQPSGGYRTTFYLSRPGERIPDLNSVLRGEY